jgi:hypothetical protein
MAQYQLCEAVLDLGVVLHVDTPIDCFKSESAFKNKIFFGSILILLMLSVGILMTVNPTLLT